MAVTRPDILQEIILNTIALGDKAVASDAYMEIEGYEGMSGLIKAFPWPVLTSQGEIEVPTPMGGAYWQQQQIKMNHQGAVTLSETVSGTVAKFLKEIIDQGGYFKARAYEGTPSSYTRKTTLPRCFFVLDNPDRDQESRSQLLNITGTMFFLYFGDDQ